MKFSKLFGEYVKLILDFNETVEGRLVDYLNGWLLIESNEGFIYLHRNRILYMVKPRRL